MAKRLNNRQILSKLVKELDEIELVFLRERIITIAKAVVDNKKEVTATMLEQGGFFSPKSLH